MPSIVTLSIPRNLDEAIEIINNLVKKYEELELENERLKKELAELKGGDEPTPSEMIPPYKKGNKSTKRSKKPGRKKRYERCHGQPLWLFTRG
ncbi:MAG: hypothetical protein DSO00_08485 [Archaeoglobi archaeon]|nr:MAG: hypothetical protein DSO00_08485 [Archaeoglobi archaeon]